MPDNLTESRSNIEANNAGATTALNNNLGNHIVSQQQQQQQTQLQKKQLILPVLPMSLSGVSAAIANANTNNTTNNNSNHNITNGVDKLDTMNAASSSSGKKFTNNQSITLLKTTNVNNNSKLSMNEETFEIQIKQPRQLLSANGYNLINSSQQQNNVLQSNSNSNMMLNNHSDDLLNGNKLVNNNNKLQLISKQQTSVNLKENQRYINTSPTNKIMATLPGAPIILNTKSLTMIEPSIQSPAYSIRSGRNTPMDAQPDSNNNNSRLLIENLHRTNSISTNVSTVSTINLNNNSINNNLNYNGINARLNKAHKAFNQLNNNNSINDSISTLSLYNQTSTYGLINEDSNESPFELDTSLYSASKISTSTAIINQKGPAVLAGSKNEPISKTNSNNSLYNASTASIITNQSLVHDSKEEALKRSEEKANRLKELDLLNTIGTGTFGRVILVKNQNTKQYFALKMMSIHDVFRLKQVEHVKNEKNVLEIVGNHPFLVKILWTHHDLQYLYMLLEYIPGGELFSLLRQRNKFETKAALFYAAEIVCALEYLHGMQIAYRDLKPENILLDVEGHLKLTDFGFAKIVTNKTYTLCGTPEYLAPEVILNRGHDMCCDWWTLGIIIFEFLSGSPPFYDENQYKVYEKILNGNSKIEWPRHFDSAAKDIIKKLLVADPTKRLGSGNCGIVSSSSVNIQQNNGSFYKYPMEQITPNSLFSTQVNNQNSPNNNNIFLTQDSQDSHLSEKDLIESMNNNNALTINNQNTNVNKNINEPMTPMNLLRKKMMLPSVLNHLKKHKSTLGAEEVKRHRWFISITNWNDVLERRLKPPFKPEILHDGDTRNFEKYETPDLYKVPFASEKQIEFFVNF